MRRRTAVLLPNVAGFPSVSMERYRNRLIDALHVVGAEKWNFDVLECDGVEPWQKLLPGPVRERARGLHARWRAYPRLAAAHRGDIHHILDHSHATLARATPPERTVVTCHDVIPLLAALGVLDVPVKPWIRSTFQMRLAAMRNAALVLADSEATRNDLIARAGFDSGRIRVVPIGIEPGFGPVPADGSDPGAEALALRQRWGLPADARVVLHVGTRNRYKNTPAVLRTVAEVARRRRDVWLVRIGAPFFDDEQASIPDLGVADRVVHAGRVDEDTLRAAYRAADVFLFPSLYEGFGWPPIEAMASGTPAVVGSGGALPEVVGDAATVVDGRDVAGLVDAVMELLENDALRDRRRESGIARAAHFTWARCAEGVLAAYGEVADRADAANSPAR